jgi:hypothetical protein
VHLSCSVREFFDSLSDGVVREHIARAVLHAHSVQNAAHAHGEAALRLLRHSFHEHKHRMAFDVLHHTATAQRRAEGQPLNTGKKKTWLMPLAFSMVERAASAVGAAFFFA